MFGLFPFMSNNYNNNNNYNNGNNLNPFYNLLNGNFINSMVDQLLSSDMMNEILDDMVNEEPYDIEFKDYGEYYLIKGYLPGIGPKDVSIDFEKNKAILTIKKKQTYSNGQNFSMTIIQTGGDLVKTFYIAEVDVSKLKASFDNGLLLLTIPKVRRLQGNSDVQSDDEATIIDVQDYKVE